METPAEFPKTLQEAVLYFADPDTAHAFMVTLRWPDGTVTCPRCGSAEVGFIRTRRIWRCKDCTSNRTFSVKTATVMEDSPLGLDTWICGFWLICNAKNGISSYEVHRALGVTQKTAWFLLHRIRLSLQDGGFLGVKMTGIVEADETFVGGRSEFMHKHVKKRRGITPGNGMVAKTAVMGLLQRPTEEVPVSRVVACVLPRMPAKRAVMKAIARNVEEGAEIHTDASAVYQDVNRDFIHEVVDHAERYVRGHVHTNGLENFWSLLKRSIKGTYVAVEPCHLFRYVAEQVFRFNTRKNKRGDQGRFLTAMVGIVGKRLTYKTLIGHDGFQGDDSDVLPA